MMKKKSIFFTIALNLFFISGNTFAENHMLILGGGGEDPGPGTIFDASIIKLSKSLKNRDWKYDILYNGGHENSEKILDYYYKKDAGMSDEFTVENYFKLFKEYKKRITEGKIKENDQLVILIDTHSANHQPKQLTHNIAAKSTTEEKDGKKITKWNQLDVDGLAELTTLAKEHNIKIGIVDLGCFSGNALQLKAPNACIISSTGTNNFSYHGDNSFAMKFIELIAAGRSMEDTFLMARVMSKSPDYPMINTTEGKKLADDFYKLLSNYMLSNSDHYKFLGDHLYTAAVDEEYSCEREKQFADLMSKIDQLSKVIFLANFQGLKNKLLDYKKSQDEIIKKTKELRPPILSNKEVITWTTQPPALPDPKTGKLVKPKPIQQTETFTWGEILFIRAEELLKEAQAQKHGPKIEIYSQILSKQKELMKAYPELKNNVKKSNEFLDAVEGTFAKASAVMAEERLLFQRGYSKGDKNPCRDIKF